MQHSTEPARARTPEKRTILLVEDHQDSAEFLARLLVNDGHEVRVAASVSAAKKLAEQSFDLLLTDITLPDGSGLDILQHLGRRRDIRAIAFSGFCSEEDVARSREAGFVAHFVKPIDFRKLRAAIEDAFAANSAGA